MGYEINVSKNGQHWFATAERSIGHDSNKLVQLHRQFQKTFPKEEGYEITVTRHESVGYKTDMGTVEQKVIEDWMSGRLHYLKNTKVTEDKVIYAEVLKLLPPDVRKLQPHEMARYMIQNNISHPRVTF